MTKKTLSELVEERESIKNEIQNNGKELLENEFVKFFEKYPDEELFPNITWWQYTPSFNDGDPCENWMGELCIGYIQGVHTKKWKGRELVDLEPKDYKVIVADEEHADWESCIAEEITDKYDDDRDKFYEAISSVYDTIEKKVMLKEAYEDLHSFLDADLLEMIYGTNKQFEVTREGISVEDFYRY